MTASLVPALLISTAVLGGSPRGVVLDFTATWCGPCQQMSPIVSRLERQGYSIRKVDVDRERELAERFGITSIPAFVLVVDGKEVTRITGSTSEEQLRRLLSQIPSDPPPVAAAPPEVPPTTNRSPVERAPADLDEPRRAPAEPVHSIDPNQAVAGSKVTAQPERKESLWGKLLGRNKEEPKPPEQPSVFRGNNPSPVPASMLPVRDPAAASVRVHVTINGQTSRGSGTAIDSRPGRTIVATCGHLFKGWNDQSKVEVDVFTDSGMQKYVGRMINFDDKADVGIVAIPTDTLIATAEVPDVDRRLREGEEAVNIGCSGGALPTEERVHVTALNYFEGPDNVECTGVPVQGRSGGGLFNRNGQLVGVCIGADAERQRGAYAGLLAVHELLDASGLTDLYRDQASPATPVAHAEPFGATGERFGSGTAQPAAPGSVPNNRGTDLAGAQALMAGGDAEVICIIRDRQQPGAPSRVVIIDRASPKFLSFLGTETTQTAMSQPHSAVRTNRVGLPAEHALSRQVAEPQSVFRTGATARPLFTRPDEPTAGPHSRSANLQPTALEGPFVPQRYVRSPSTRR